MLIYNYIPNTYKVRHIMQPLIKLKALIVEDDKICIKILSAQLSSLNYKIDESENPDCAINKINSNSYDVIITDIGLNSTKKGDDVIKSVKKSEINRNTPVLVSSAHVGKKDFAYYKAIGASYVLIKPYSTFILERHLKIIFNTEGKK